MVGLHSWMRLSTRESIRRTERRNPPHHQSESGRDIRFGWRLGWRPGRTGSGRMDFGLGVEAARYEQADGDAPENRVGLTAAMHG